MALAAMVPHHARAAGGAFAVDDVEVSEPGACKVESWVSGATNSDLIAVTSPACVVNLGRPVEIGLQYQRSRAAEAWSTSGALKAKTNLLPVEINKIGLGVSGAVGYDFLTGQVSSYAVNVPVTIALTEQFRINLNAGYLRETSDRLNWLTWGAGFEWNFIKPLTLIGEVYGQSGRLIEAGEDEAPTPNALRQPRVQAGLRVTPMEKIDLDFIYGHNITGENAHWVTFGLNVRF